MVRWLAVFLSVALGGCGGSHPAESFGYPGADVILSRPARGKPHPGFGEGKQRSVPTTLPSGTTSDSPTGGPGASGKPSMTLAGESGRRGRKTSRSSFRRSWTASRGFRSSMMTGGREGGRSRARPHCTALPRSGGQCICNQRSAFASRSDPNRWRSHRTSSPQRLNQ